MALSWLQNFIEATFPSACVPVDLLKIARNHSYPNPPTRSCSEYGYSYEFPEFYFSTPFCVVIDGENCLHRLYGGFFGDWVCGGQWNRMIDYLSTFVQVLISNNIEVTVFFNGASEPNRLEKWIEKQRANKEKMTQVLRHVSIKGTPPPKVWWVPPNALRSSLRMALRHLNVNVILSVTDHHQDIMNFIRMQHYHGLIAEDSEYLVLDPPRLFSAENLKLTFKGCLETKEYIMNEVTRCLNLHPSRICIVAALLGNQIITDLDLAAFHHSLTSNEKEKVQPNKLITAVVDFVRNIPSVDDLDVVAKLVFGQCKDKVERFKRCVLYYARGNKNATRFHTNGPDVVSSGNSATVGQIKQANTTNRQRKDQDGTKDNKFASETLEIERSSLKAYREVLSKGKHGGAGYHILTHQEDKNNDNALCNSIINGAGDGKSASNCKKNLNEGSSSSDTLSLEASISTLSLNSKDKKNQKHSSFKPNTEAPLLPKVSAEVMRMARERHETGLMNPSVFQVLSQGELRLSTTFEDESGHELPSPSIFFRPLRQMVYALLFNHHHLNYLAEQKKEGNSTAEKPPEIIIKEWVWSKTNRYNKPDLVPSMPLSWAVPTITRLWFGSGPEENQRRLQAFLTCMRSNNQLMLNTDYVPQHCLILCCVLRYIMSHPDGAVIRKQELDAFLAQAVNPLLTDVTETQKLELPLVTTRGVQLASLFMTGVENALFANDACGAPIPWLMCCPWLFFDGKLFHRLLLKAYTAKNSYQLCDDQPDEIGKVERMRAAILQDLNIQYACYAVPSVAQKLPGYQNLPMPVPGIGRGRGHQRVVPRGGQLEVAGVVVGSWGPNYGQGPRSPSRTIPPQIVSVGGASSRGRGNTMVNIPRGPIFRPIMHSAKANSASRKPVTKTKPELSRSNENSRLSEHSAVFRTLGRGCSLTTMNRESNDFANAKPTVKSDRDVEIEAWSSSLASEIKEL